MSVKCKLTTYAKLERFIELKCEFIIFFYYCLMNYEYSSNLAIPLTPVFPSSISHRLNSGENVQVFVSLIVGVIISKILNMMRLNFQNG